MTLRKHRVRHLYGTRHPLQSVSRGSPSPRGTCPIACPVSELHCVIWNPQKIQLRGAEYWALLQQGRPVSRRQPPVVQKQSDPRTSTLPRLPPFPSRPSPHCLPASLLKGTALDPGPGSPSRPTHHTASAPAQRLRCVVFATKFAQSAPVGFLPPQPSAPPFRSLIRTVFTIDF